MRHAVLMVILTGMILLLLSTVPVSAESSTITSVSPTVGYTGGSTTVTITGTDFNTSSVKVRLMMDDESNISASITSHTSTTIVCKFTLSSSKEKGDWDLVVVNDDGSEVVDSSAFTIRSPMKLTAITPETARTNDDDVEFTLDGTGLSDVTDLYLYKKSYDNISAEIDDVDSTGVTGIFDLTDVDEETYKVCVMDSFDTRRCDLSFEVTTDELGSIDVSSSPSGASLYVDSEYMGTTPYTVDDLATGTHKVSLVKAGYDDWAKLVKVTQDDTTVVDATLDVVTIATTAPTPTPVPTAVPATTATRISTITIPTAWPTSTTATTTQASPLGIPLIIGALGLAVLIART
jgi:hypothetical protein